MLAQGQCRWWHNQVLRKLAEALEIAAKCRVASWKAVIYPVEVGFICTSTSRLLRDKGVLWAKLLKAGRKLAKELEKACFWLWIRRKDWNLRIHIWSESQLQGRQGDTPLFHKQEMYCGKEWNIGGLLAEDHESGITGGDVSSRDGQQVATSVCTLQGLWLNDI